MLREEGRRAVSPGAETMPRSISIAAALLAASLAPPAARAHEVLHQVERSGAIAVRVYFADGEPVAHQRYEVYSPADPASPFLSGRTDRRGWLAFVPDTAGRWRVKVADAGGHGFEAEVEAQAQAEAAERPSTGAVVLRSLAGLAAIGAVFAALFGTYRRRGAGR